MNKRTKTALTVAVIMIVLGFAISFFAHGRGESIFNSGLMITSGVNFGSEAGYTVCTTGEFTLAPDEAALLDIDWLSGSVRVERYEGDNLLVREECSRDLTDAQRMRWKLSGQKLSVRFCANGQKQIPDKTLTVLVPKGWAREEVNVDASSADVLLSGIQVNETLSVATASGSIQIENCTCSSLITETASGDMRAYDSEVRGLVQSDAASGCVSMQNCTAERLESDTSSGVVDFAGKLKEADVDTSSGAVSLAGLGEGSMAEVETASGGVTIQFDGKPKSINVDAVSGDIKLILPQGTGLDLDYETASGSLKGKPLYLGSGDVPVQVETSSGDLTIEYQ